MAVVPIFHIKVDPVWQYFSALPTPVRKCCFLLAILTLPQTLNLCSVQHSFPFSPAFLILVYPHQQLWLCNQSLGLLGLQAHSGLLISNTCFALFPLLHPMVRVSLYISRCLLTLFSPTSLQYPYSIHTEEKSCSHFLSFIWCWNHGFNINESHLNQAADLMFLTYVWIICFC